MPMPPRLGPLARWGLIGAPVLMAVALLLTVWASYAGVRDASVTLISGEALAMQGQVRARLQELGAPPSTEDLTALLNELAPDGLRLVAVADRSSGTLLRAGSSRLDDAGLLRAATSQRPGVIVEEGPRIRVAMRGRPPRRGHTEAAPWRGPPDAVLLELAPVQADTLRKTAARTLGVGAAGGSALLLVALALARWWQRRERLERERERERRLASLGQLSAVLAHEIRNPLASLKGNAQLLAQSLPQDQPPRTKADRVVREAIRLETLTNDLLEFARTAELHVDEVDPAALLRDAAADLAHDDIHVNTEGAPATWPLDGARMTRVLTNLLDNAVKAGPPVRASVTLAGAQLVFEVADEGPGVAAEDVAHIFEPFFTRRVHGTGLGLAVAKRVVEMHGGSISVTGAQPKGARFRVFVPRA